MLRGISEGEAGDFMIYVVAFAFIAAGFAVYFLSRRKFFGGDAQQGRWGLSGDEKVTLEAFGEVDVDISAGEQLATIVSGFALGALFGGISVARKRPPRVNFCLTSSQRIGVDLEVEEDRFETRFFPAGAVRFVATSPGRRPSRLNGRPTTVTRLLQPDGTVLIEALLDAPTAAQLCHA
jgi:hypothetical protein